VAHVLLFAGDALTYHRGVRFSTPDQDNDSAPRRSCALQRQGAWWYNSCAIADLNAPYPSSPRGGLRWGRRNDIFYYVRSSEMKIRPA